MTDQPYPDPPRQTIEDLDPEMATTDRLIAMVRSHRAGEEYPTAEVLLGNLPKVLRRCAITCCQAKRWRWMWRTGWRP